METSGRDMITLEVHMTNKRFDWSFTSMSVTGQTLAIGATLSDPPCCLDAGSNLRVKLFFNLCSGPMCTSEGIAARVVG